MFLRKYAHQTKGIPNEKQMVSLTCTLPLLIACNSGSDIQLSSETEVSNQQLDFSALDKIPDTQTKSCDWNRQDETGQTLLHKIFIAK